MAQAKFNTVDEYFAAQQGEVLSALQKLRSSILNLIPEAEEYISYQIPTIRYLGKPLLSYGGAKHHYAIYTLSDGVMEKIKKDLSTFDHSGVTIRFGLHQKVPSGLLKRIILERQKEIKSRLAKK